jgi:hypothetical protein
MSECAPDLAPPVHDPKIKEILRRITDGLPGYEANAKDLM